MGDTPRLDAEVLLRHVLAASRAALFAAPERSLTPVEAARYAALLTRRAAGEPVAYLTGHREFMGLDFCVDRRVLIPRPETEVLVERALAALTALTALTARGSAPGGRPVRAADVGTGSGAIAVSLAALAPSVLPPNALQVVAVDSSAGALAVAQENARRLVSGAARRVWLVRSRTLAAVCGPLDVIAANLPYIPHAAMADLPRTVRDYEPWTALDGGADGLDAYQTLLSEVQRRLAPGGTLLMECDPVQVSPLSHLAAAAMPDATVTTVRDLAGLERIVAAVRR